MRLKHLILLISLSILEVVNAFGELTLKNIFEKANITTKTKSTDPNAIKQSLTDLFKYQLTNLQALPSKKKELLQTLITNVISGLERSGGNFGFAYGTKISKKTLESFIEIIEANMKKDAKENILLSAAILNESCELQITPGLKWTGATTEDEPIEAQKEIKGDLTLNNWIEFLKYYKKQHEERNIPGDFYVLNPVKIYTDFFTTTVAKSSAEEAKKAEEIQISKQIIAAALEKAKKEAEELLRQEEDTKKKAEEEQQKKDDEAKEESATTEMQALLLRKKDAKETAKKKEAAINMQALLRKSKAETEKKKEEEQKKKDDEAKEEERKKKEAEALEQQEQAKIAADKLSQEQAEVAEKQAEEPAKKTPPLEHPTKTRARQKQKRRPTKSGKESQQQKQALEEKQLEHQKKVETLSDLINLAEAKISTSEGEMPTYQAFKYNKLTQEQLDTLKKELESKINEANQYTDLEVLLPTLIEELYKTNKELENDIGMLTEMLNVLFPNLEDIKQFGTKILDISKMVIKLEPQECIKMIINLIDSTTLIAGIVKVKSYEKINDKTRKLLTSAISEFKTKIISLSNRLTEQVDSTTIQTAIDNLKPEKFTPITQAFLNLNYAPSERQANTKLDIIIKAIEARAQKTKSEQDKKAQDAAEAAAAEAKAAQEKKLSAAAEKKQGEETVKAKIKQEWDSEIAKIQQIAPENIQISDLDFIKEDKYKGLNFDTNSSSLILKFIQNLCKQLDQKNDRYLEKLSNLLIKIKNKTKDSQQQKDFNLLDQYVNTWNLLNKIYQKRDIVVEKVSLSKIGLTLAQTYLLKQSDDTNISEIKGYADELKDTKKYPNLSTLLKKMIQDNIITFENLQIIYTILHNVLDPKYEDLVIAVKESIASVKGIGQPASQPAGTQQKGSVKTTKPKTPKSPSSTTAKAHKSEESSALKQKLTYLKQNLEKLKTKLSQLSQNLNGIKMILQKK